MPGDHPEQPGGQRPRRRRSRRGPAGGDLQRLRTDFLDPSHAALLPDRGALARRPPPGHLPLPATPGPGPTQRPGPHRRGGRNAARQFHGAPRSAQRSPWRDPPHGRRTGAKIPAGGRAASCPAHGGLTVSPHGEAWPVMMACGLLPSRPASQIVPLPRVAQYRWLASAATPSGKFWPVMMALGLLPSRLASQIAPEPDNVLAAQYRWPPPTATPAGTFWPVTMACGLLPSRPASQIAPSPWEKSVLADQ